jgi:hypothetical protein
MSLDEAQLNSMSIREDIGSHLNYPIDLNEVHHSDRVVTVDKPLPAWGKNQTWL